MCLIATTHNAVDLRYGHTVSVTSFAQNSHETALAPRGRPFPPGVSGNPGGRPKGLARYVRELVGDDGRRIADFMLNVLDDQSERTETRLKAAEWLAERGFGKAPTQVELAEGATAIVVKGACADDPESLAGVVEVLARVGVLPGSIDSPTSSGGPR